MSTITSDTLERIKNLKEPVNKKIYRCFNNVENVMSVDYNQDERNNMRTELLKDTSDIISFALNNMRKPNIPNSYYVPSYDGRQENDILFAHLLSVMDRKIDFNRIPAAMAISTETGTELILEINPYFLFGRILDRLEENPEFSEADMLESLTSNNSRASVYYLAQIISILVHEAFHVISEHLSVYANEISKGKHHMTMMNYATDCVINEKLTNIPSSTISHKKLADMLEDPDLEKSNDSMFYYRRLIEKIPEEEPNTPMSQDDFEEMIEQLNEDLENMSDEQLENFKDMIKENMDSHDGWSNQNGENDYPTELISDLVKETFKEAIENYEEERELNSKSRGTLSGDLQEMVDLVKEKSKMNWRQILRRKIGALPVPYRLSKNRINRRQAFRPELRGRINDRIVKVVFGIDTSASMSDEDIQYALSEVFSILSVYKFELTVIEFDASVNKIYKVRNRNRIQTNMSGRGGTSFQPLFNWLRSNRVRNNETITIIATDGGGEQQVDTFGYTNIMWLLMGQNDQLSVENFKGEIFRITEDRKYQNITRENTR